MRSIYLLLVAMTLIGSSCSATSASTCAEYSAEVRAMIDSGASGEELNAFVEDTEQHVAKLISNDPNNAGPCADAIFEAVFTGAFDDFEEFLDS